MSRYESNGSATGSVAGIVISTEGTGDDEDVKEADAEEEEAGAHGYGVDAIGLSV